jgi:hypothetical protein
MENSNKIINSLDRHIKELESRLEAIYTVIPPKKYPGNEEKVNLLNKINELQMLESIYEVIDGEDIKISKTAIEYSDYLSAVRIGLEVLLNEKASVEEEHGNEIKNISLLLTKFRDERSKY